MVKRKVRKGILIALIAIFGFVLLVVLCISPIAKYIIQKYDERFLGRQVQVSFVYLNPFAGKLHLRNLKIYEKEGSRIFFSVKDFGININMLKLLNKTYEISRISLNSPVTWIITDKKKTNLDDLLQKFASKDTLDTVPKKTTHFNILNIKITNGEFHYWEQSIPVKYFIRQVNIESKGMKWDSDSMNVKFSFLSGPATGSMKGDCTLKMKELTYRLNIAVKKYDLRFIQDYMRDMANYGTFRANLDADMKVTGNMKDKQDIDAKGIIYLNDFHFGKSRTKDYASFSKLTLGIEKLSPKGLVYAFDSIILEKPYVTYEKYDYLDNIQRMFGKKGSGVKEASREQEEKFNLIIELANYVKLLSHNFFRSDYRIKKLGIYDGNLQYRDYSLNEKFSLAANPFNFVVDSIDKSKKKVDIHLKTELKPYGDVAIGISVNPRDTDDFDLNYRVSQLPLTMFNPYVITFTSFPLDRGTLEFNGKWKVRNGKLNSENHIRMNDPHITRTLTKREGKKLPLPLILSFVRERDNLVDYKIPISGDLKDPRFNLWDVVTDALANIFIKPVSLPYVVQVDHVNKEIEKYLTIKWMPAQTTLSEQQERFMKKVKNFLKDNKEASVTITPINYEDKEKEYILFYEAKKKYFLSVNNKDAAAYSKDDSVEVDKMSVKESNFLRYLNKQVDTTALFTVQDKCRAFVGHKEGLDSLQVLKHTDKIVDKKYANLQKDREVKFRSYFRDDDIEDRIKIEKSETAVPFDGFSFYKINYEGDIPKRLLEAYQEMNELGDKSPVKRYLYRITH
jgi:hypothetical protein